MTMVQFTNSFLKNEFKQSYGYYDVKDQDIMKDSRDNKGC